MKILFAYRGIDNIAGGVEKMTATIMNALSARGHEMRFLTLDRADAVSFYPHDERIAWHKLNLGDFREKATLSDRIKRAVAARRIIKNIRPDVIVGFQYGSFLSMRVYTVGMNIPVVLAERIAPDHLDHVGKSHIKNMLFQTLRMASAITVQCPSYVAAYPSFLRGKITVISNPVDMPDQTANPAGRTGERKILFCAGRISFQKNQLLLVKIFTRLKDEYPDWDVHLAGGEEDFSVRKCVEDNDLSSRVIFLSAVKNMQDVYKNAHLFCLPSRWEGFPNALAEAMAHGLPTIGFEACGGVRDLIKHDVSGLLAAGNNNEDTLCAALKMLMADDARRVHMGLAGRENMKQYAPEKIITTWEHFLKQVAQA